MLRTWKRMRAPAALAAALLLAAAPSLAKGVNPFINQNISCGTYTEKLERSHGIPGNLLDAISLAETGRWDPRRGVKFAWPWTVTAQGKSTYFDTKAEAMAETKRLLATGVASIDVGCMQVNLYYHPNAFGSIDEALDPAHNVAYAARFLSELKHQTGSWVKAAAHYHSSDPLKNQSYRRKVLALWEDVRGAPLGDAHDLVEDVDPDDDAKRQALQSAALQMRFRARLQAERDVKGRDKRQKELDAWRMAKGNPQLLAQQATKRQAERNRQQQEIVNRSAEDFAAKRRAQLAKWRTKNAELHNRLTRRAQDTVNIAEDVKDEAVEKISDAANAIKDLLPAGSR